MSTNSLARCLYVCALLAGVLTFHAAASFAADTFEPNDTLQTATPIASGSPRVSYVSTSSDNDYYTFTISGSQHVRIDLTAPDTVDYQITLYDGTGDHIGSSSGFGAGADDRFDRTLVAGVYYIRVNGFPHDAVNSYTLTLTAPLPGDDFEPNNTQATAAALQLGTTIGAFLFTSNDADWYRIVTVADGHLVVTLNVPDSVDYQLTVRDGSGNFFESSSNFGAGQDEEIVTTVPAGTYFIEVRTSGNYSQGQRYFLTAASGAFTDSFEPNNTRASARRVGPGTLLSKVYTSDDQDWYRFNVSATGTVSIVLEVPPSADLRLELTSSSGSFIAFASTSGLGVDESMVRVLTGPGAYFLLVSASTPSRSEDYALTFGGSTITTPFTVPGDFDANGLTDFAVYRSATGIWRIRNQFDVQFGDPGDLPVPGDYNGDDIADIAVYRPSTGAWYVRNQFAVQFGEPGDVPVPADYNADGITDIAVYRPSTGYWYARGLFAIQYGAPGDVPVPADYNGDGAVDVAVYRPGFWRVRNQFVVAFGERGDVPVPGDYDGSGDADVAVYRPSTGAWHVLDQPSKQLGGAGFRPVPGDYNNDGITDAAVYELASGVWSVLNQFAVKFGDADDLPVPRPFLTPNRAASDFDGDGTTDVGMYRPSTGQWLVPNRPTVQFGDPGDIPVPGDYNRDGVVDVAVYRPSTGMWFVRNQLAAQFGDPSDIPVPGDYNGDRRADFAVYRPSTGTWYVRNVLAVQFGDPGDIPVPGDYNGDGITDLAVYRPSTGTWYVRNLLAVRFGDAGDVPIPGDYDGDGKTDLAVFRPSTTMWMVRDLFNVPFGVADDVLVPGDYDGDGAADPAVYRTSTGTWHIRNQFSLRFGEAGDEPLVRGPGTP